MSRPLLCTLILLFALGTAFSGRPAHAAGCGAPDLRLDEGNGSMVHVPVQSQENLRTCFAFAAAQIFDAYRFSHGDRNYAHPTSAMALAIENTVDNQFLPALAGGYTQDALETLKSRGACSQQMLDERFSRMDERDVIRTLRSFLSTDSYNRLVAENNRRVDEQRRLAAKPLPPPPAKPAEPAPVRHPPAPPPPSANKNCATCSGSSAAVGVDESLRFQGLYDVVARYFKDTPYVQEFYREVLTKLCPAAARTHASIQVHKVDRNALNTKAKLLQIIHERLSAPGAPQPVGIGYCHNVLTDDPKYAGVINVGFSAIYTKSCRAHESLIIGRRTFKGKCQFLIRDSWGASCTPYLSHWPCEYGKGIWIDSDALLNNIGGLDYVE